MGEFANASKRQTTMYLMQALIVCAVVGSTLAMDA
jgi:hypothetical protein